MITIALFNNRGGAGKTTFAYHLAHMFPRLGYRTLAVDLDPQANLTAAFFDEDVLEKVWDEAVAGLTVLNCLQPMLEGTGDIAKPAPLWIDSDRQLAVLCGDLGLSRFEDKTALSATTGFYRMIQEAGRGVNADVALVDLGPNLGAINRSALLACDCLVVPLAADLLSLQGLKNLGPAVREWRSVWNDMRGRAKADFDLPAGVMRPLGYVMLQHAVRTDRPAKWYGKWLERVPEVYRTAVLGETEATLLPHQDHCLATLRNYRSLMPMAQEARKPMFDLTPADGAIGSHAQLVRVCEQDFRHLAVRVAEAAGLQSDSPTED